uniref:Evasin n=1 Tax=Amblyomma cajennense TaxID=34607 RepID=A0A023FSY8_AMBCJ
MTPATPFAIVIFLCASQALVGFSSSEVSGSLEEDLEDLSDEACDPSNDNSSCIIQGLNTTGHPLSVGCVITCKNSTRHLPNRTECLTLSTAAANAMQSNVNYTCPVGLCFNGQCEPNGLAIGCWHDTPPPNSTSVTTKAPTTTATSASSV